ncbi:hypothetical protein OAG52_02205 [Verrucomicrobia bacterium]|jgi:hypothetical protein|nr:hypothetical protein [Verrucomicrobiota bacterium]
MTNEEAKFILSAYRPNGCDASDPAMAEALEQVARDPELGDWFREELAMDRVISKKLTEVSVPDGLRGNILTGHRMMEPTDSIGWRVAAVMKWAAVFIAFVGIAVFLSLRDPADGQIAQYRSDMMGLLAMKAAPLDYQGRSLSNVRNWLKDNHSLAQFEVSHTLANQPTMGCQVLEWNGAQVTLVCFDTGDGQLAHLLVVDRSAFPDLGELSEPVMESVAGWTTASWVSKDRVYLLAGKGERPEIRAFL